MPKCNDFHVFANLMCIYNVYTFSYKYIYSVCIFCLYRMPAAANKRMHFATYGFIRI